MCDLSLGPDHWWGWLCDLRSQEAESLVQVHPCSALKSLSLMIFVQLMFFAFFLWPPSSLPSIRTVLEMMTTKDMILV